MMDNEQKFDVRFAPDAAKEYSKLKNPTLTFVNKALDELEFRADEVGKPLGNKRDMKLAGCKEIKLRDAGIRIIFRITDTSIDILQVVQVLAIEKRSNDMVFKIASRRLAVIKRDKSLDQLKHISHIRKKISTSQNLPIISNEKSKDRPK